MEHTKGNWTLYNPAIHTYGGQPLEESEDIIIVCEDDDIDWPWQVAKVMQSCGEGDEEYLFNAKLIKAAPDLLKACVEAEKYHQGGHSEIGFLLREAIKKATE